MTRLQQFRQLTFIRRTIMAYGSRGKMSSGGGKEAHVGTGHGQSSEATAKSVCKKLAGSMGGTYGPGGGSMAGEVLDKNRGSDKGGSNAPKGKNGY